MKKEIERVAEFHKTFGHPVWSYQHPENLSLNDEARMELRIRLLREEIDELERAMKDKDNIEVLDALADTAVILFGTALETGYGEILPEAFHKVMDSNMSKICRNEQELNDTKKKYWKEGIDVVTQKVDAGFVVKRKTDDKILKNEHYRSAYSMLYELMKDYNLPPWKRFLKRIWQKVRSK